MPKTLLLADGSVTIQRVVELTFAHEDIRVVAVSDGPRALSWLDGARPDIVLVDVDLPEVDGYGVVAHLKKNPRLRNVPVLLLAGAFEPVDQERARTVGCDGIVVKPFEPQHVVARVKELLAAAVGVSTSVGGREGSSKSAPSFSGPSDSPALAILRAGATSRTPEPESKAPRLDAVSTRAEAQPGPSAFLRTTAMDPVPATAPEKLELPTRPIWDMGAHATASSVPGPQPAAAPALAAPAAPTKVSLASAFSALLAAEQSAPPVAAAGTPPPVQVVSDASIEDAVRRVLVRMTDDLVRRIVVDTAERLIREEIQKIKDNPE